MKRLFIWVSTVLVALFLLVMISTNKHIITFSSYESVDIVGQRNDMKSVSREAFASSLNQLAKETNSVIARRIVEPQKDGKTRFAYDIYGNNRLPDEVVVASKQTSLSSDLISSYLILSHGSLASHQLSKTIYDLGFNNIIIPAESPFRALTSITINDVSIVSLGLLLLAYLSIVLIYSIKDLKTAGIRYVAGWSYRQIMWHAIITDVKLVVGTTVLLSSLGSIILIINQTFQVQTLLVFLLGMFIYAIMLITLSLMLSLIYLINLKGTELVGILKGKLPLKRLLALLLLGQLSATVAVGWTVNGLLSQYQEIKIKEQAAKEWKENADYFQLVFGYSAGMLGEKEEQKQNKQWYDFANATIQQGESLFVYSTVEKLYYEKLFGYKEADNNQMGSPVIFVTPNYLLKQKVPVDETFRKKMNQLSLGEFGLIIPKKLSDKQTDIESIMTKEMSGFASVDLFPEHDHLFDVTAITTLVKNGDRRFIYNTSRNVSTQYLEDPIIVVTTPRSMGDTVSSHLFWGVNLATSLHMKGYEEIKAKLKDAGLYQSISYILNDRLSYLTRLNDSRIAFAIFIAGTF